jgi:hypothetical protein
MFGGTRGGGKSDCLLGRQIRGAELWGWKWNGLIIRRKYKDFAELRRRIDELIALGMPAERIGGEQQPNYIKFANGARITMVAVKQLNNIADYLGHQYTEISIDEASSIPFIAQLIEKLKGCLRSPHGVPCHMFLTGNPGGAGANSIKMMYIKKAPPNTVFMDHVGESAIFIPSSLADNKILCDMDPTYVRRLQSIKDPALRAAWLLGDWDSFTGQAFDFSREFHVIPWQTIPDYAPIYTTFDWGFGAPFSHAWWWVDGDNRVYRFAEWYGWDGVTPNIGIRMEDSKIADGIIEREKKLKLKGKDIIRLASHDCWNKKPDYQGGGQGPSTAEVFTRKGLYLTKADPSRHLKIRQFRERLKVNFLNLEEIAHILGLSPIDHDLYGHVWEDAGHSVIREKDLVERARALRMQLKWPPPMMLVYENCEQFIRTIPDLCVDDMDVEDIDTDLEDHIYDDAAQICLARPMSLELPTVLQMPNMAEIFVDKIESEEAVDPLLEMLGLDGQGEELYDDFDF